MSRHRTEGGFHGRHKRLNLIQSVLLLFGMVALLSACGFVIAGPEGIFWAFLIGTTGLLVAPRVTPCVMLAMYGGIRIARYEMPAVTRTVDALGKRAGLRRVPDLYYIPSATPNAFTVGNRNASAIAVTDGLLRRLDLRELTGVLAHEISHIRNGDTWVMGLADMISRLTRLMSTAGLLLVMVTLPILTFYGQPAPWLLIPLLIVAPILGALLQRALSRTREFDADLDAVSLTGDPVGLAGALKKLDHLHGRRWEGLMPSRRSVEPSLLRTHPPTQDRIRRLLEHSPGPAAFDTESMATVDPPIRYGPVTSAPRRRLTGLWY